VGPGQAGGEVVCSGCGRTLAVPTLRELRGLPSMEGSAGSRARGFRAGTTGWGTAQSILAAGAALALISLATASWLARPASTGIDEAVIRDAIARAPAADLYRAWTSLEGSGVARPATPGEEQVIRLTRNRAVLAMGIGLLGAIGGVTAAGAALVIASRRWIRSS
jgi:hypothetical protein